MRIVQVGNLKIGEGLPKIIVPLVGKTKQELLAEARNIAQLEPDMIEWRADLYEEVDHVQAVVSMVESLKEIVKGIPLLFTFRTVEEGGDRVIPHSYYWTLLESIVQTRRVELIDVELFYDQKPRITNFIDKAKECGTKVIMSNHDFEKTPAKEELAFRLYQMEKLGADILKLAVMPNTTRDVLNLMDITLAARENGLEQPIITMAMGQLGLITRLSGEVFGSAATFAAGQQASAPGQIDIGSIRSSLQLLKI